MVTIQVSFLLRRLRRERRERSRGHPCLPVPQTGSPGQGPTALDNPPWASAKGDEKGNLQPAQGLAALDNPVTISLVAVKIVNDYKEFVKCFGNGF
jgi:hypothetical protein